MNGPERARFWRSPGLPGVDLLKARYVTHRFTPHAHESYTIALVLSGMQEFGYRGARHHASAGSLSTLNPQEVHHGHAGVPEGWTYRVLYPSVEFVSGIAAEVMTGRGTPASPRPSPTTGPPSSCCGPRTRPRSTATTSPPRRWPAPPSPPCSGATPPAPPEARSHDQDPAVRRAREILHERLVDPPTIEDLARAVDARPFTLIRAFKAATGLPPHAYLNTLRIMRARRLLQAGTPPAQVAGDVGFTDQAHLSRHFKRMVGVPPAAYQRAGTYKTGT